MRILFYVILLFPFSFVFATNSDSLAKDKVLKTHNKLALNFPVLEIVEFKKQIKMAHSLKIDTSWIVEHLEYYLGQNYSKIGDFERAIELGTNHLKHYQDKGDFISEIWAFNDLGIYYSNNKQFNESIKMFEMAIQISKKNKYFELLPDLTDGIAMNYLMLNKIELAEKNIKKTDLLIANAQNSIYEETQLYCYFTKANYFDKINNYNQAELNYINTISLGIKLDHRKAFDARINLAKLFLKLARVEEAKNTLLPILQKLDIVNNSNVKEAYLKEAYFVLAKVYKKLSMPDSALWYIDKSEEQEAFFQSQYMFNKSKFFHNKDRRNNLALGVDIAYEQYSKTRNKKYLIKALIYADQAKSNVLNERQSASLMLGDKRITQEVKDLRSFLLFKLNENEHKNESKKAISIRNSLDSLDNVLGLKKVSLFDLKDIKSFQNKLKTNQVVLEYFIADTILFCFSISNKHIDCNRKVFNRRKEIIAFYSLLHDPNSSINQFNQIGSSLYTYFFNDINALKKEIIHLIIVPDEVLNYLVFDALPINNFKNNRWAKVEYLGKTHSISYGFSLQSLNRTNKQSKQLDYIGFAPNFNYSTTLAPLQFGKSTVDLGLSIFGGHAFNHSDATYDNFRLYGMQSSLLQLYTHGVASDSSYNASYIYLQDKKVYVDEILNLPFYSDLCLLTACDVGLGKEFKGEGITGVSWAFRAAGAKNIVQSMWKLNEKVTAEILSFFYTHLANGETSIEALRKAKMDYTNSSEVSDRLKHPFYWAGMNHYGMGAHISAKSNTWFWWLFGAMGCGLMFLLFKRTRATKSSF